MKPISLWQKTLTTILGLMILLPSGICLGEILTIEEEFSSTLYRDVTSTTADWDTTALNVHLFPQILTTRGNLPTTNAFQAVMGPTHLFLADGSAGLRSIDISDPDSPTTAHTLVCAGNAEDVAIGGNYAYVAVGSAGLQVINISNPENMTDEGSFDPDLAFAKAVAIYSNALYIAESNSGVAVFDISSPANPVFVRHVSTTSWARHVAVSNGNLFVSDNNLLIFDLTDPLDPSLTSDTPIDGTALKTSFAGDRAFVACGASGLQIFDISNLLSPSLLGQISEWSNCRHATATTSGDTVYAAVDTEGLTILEVSDPENYDILDTRSTVGPAFHVVLQDDLIYLSTGSEGLRIYEFDPIGLNSDDNQAQSIDLYTDDDPVARVALTAAYSDSIAFQVTVNGGTTWHSIIPENGFFQFPETGTDVRWRANLVATEAGGENGPILDMVRLSLDRLSSYGSISSVEDIANDDGREVRLSWQASRHDAQGGEHTITEYSIYRRYDGAAQSASAKSSQPGAPYPPGQWDYLSTVPADFESQYSLVVPTLADSNSTGTNWTAFFVRTRTTVHGVFFDSPPDSGYSVNNLQPAAPTGWFVDYSPANGTQLDWNPSDDPQFAHFRVYRSLVQDTPVQPGTLFAVTTESDYFDETESHWYYQLTQVNHEGHESQPAHPGLSDAPQSSSKLHLMRNVPNPFNPITVLKFSLADDSLPVELDIFDVRGKRVRSFTAMDLPVGEHQIRWDGRDSAGRGCASGVYQARLRQGQEQRDIKMMLVR